MSKKFGRSEKPRRRRKISNGFELRWSKQAIEELESQLKLKDFLKASDIILYKSEIKEIKKEINKYQESLKKCHT